MPDDGEEIDALLVQYNAQFAERGIVFRRLCACTKRVLVLVYNEEQLTQALRNPGYQAYLIAAGYEAGASAEAYLHRLEQRLNTQKTFPHEIGVFLGYPLEDILGFVLNKGTDCKYSGYWKVYGDVPKARSIFAAYEHFRDIILSLPASASFASASSSGAPSASTPAATSSAPASLTRASQSCI